MSQHIKLVINSIYEHFSVQLIYILRQLSTSTENFIFNYTQTTLIHETINSVLMIEFMFNKS